jgi:hypothetical protein
MLKDWNFSEPRFKRAFLIQLYGRRHGAGCTRCQEKGDFLAFYECRTIENEYDKCCGDCKRFDLASKCSSTKVGGPGTWVENKTLKEAQEREKVEVARSQEVLQRRNLRPTVKRPAQYSNGGV